jgi:hypothetical protein
MKKKKKIILSVIAIIVVVCAIFYKAVIAMFMGIMANVAPYIWKAKDVSKETAAYTMVSDSLYNAFKSDTATANKKYVGQVIMVTGSISAIDSASNTVSLGNVACAIDSTDVPKIGSHKIGDNVKIQGIVVDYNDLLDDIDVSQCYFK